MTRVLVAGLTNLETTARVPGFPVPYAAAHYPFHGVRATVSGVGYNIARALTVLGHEVRLLSLIGGDAAGELVLAQLRAEGIAADGVLRELPETAHSAILYDETGRRMVLTDLKDIQEQSYPAERARAALAGCALAVICNINFARPLLGLARTAGMPVASDVHAVHDLEDAYNADFMAGASLLFMSHERLPAAPATWAEQVMARYSPEALVIGLGADGAFLATAAGDRWHAPARRSRPIINTIGAGDALLAAYVHGVLEGREPRDALGRAVYFAGHKIGESGGAAGFLTADELNAAFK